MAMFTAYFDGSGSPDDTVALVVAGFLCTAEQWIHFERNWNECLKHFGVSALHMRDFAHSRREFASWKGDEEKRQHFLRWLVGIILTRVRHSFASAVVMDDYRKVDSKYCLSEFSKPYALAGCTCLAKVRAWAQKWNIDLDDIRYVFEDGDKDKGDFIRAADKHFHLTPDFLKKEKGVAFQAADLLAYEHLLANKRICETADRMVIFEELRYPLKDLSSIPGARNGGDWGVHREDDMTDSCIKENIPLRV
jgi:hypothetical protein